MLKKVHFRFKNSSHALRFRVNLKTMLIITPKRFSIIQKIKSKNYYIILQEQTSLPKTLKYNKGKRHDFSEHPHKMSQIDQHNLLTTLKLRKHLVECQLCITCLFSGENNTKWLFVSICAEGFSVYSLFSRVTLICTLMLSFGERNKIFKTSNAFTEKSRRRGKLKI